MSEAKPNITPQSEAAKGAWPAFDVSAWIEDIKQHPGTGGHDDSPPPPHPDDDLLELAGESLHIEKQLANEYKSLCSGGSACEINRLEKKLKNHLRRARKLCASTPAGLYAKALLVRRSKTGAVILAQSLVADMLSMTEFRRTLWPAADADADAELIELCAEAETLQRCVNGPNGVQESYYERIDEVVAKGFDLRATTLCGHQARAKFILASHESWAFFEQEFRRIGVEGVALAALIRDLAVQV